MIFDVSFFLHIKLEPTMIWSPRRRSHGLHNYDSSCDQNQCFWLAGVRNFTNTIIEYRNWYLDFRSEWHHPWFGDLTTPRGEADQKSRFQFLFYHAATMHAKFMQTGVCKSRKLLWKLLESATLESTASDHCHSSLLEHAPAFYRVRWLANATWHV